MTSRSGPLRTQSRTVEVPYPNTRCPHGTCPTCGEEHAEPLEQWLNMLEIMAAAGCYAPSGASIFLAILNIHVLSLHRSSALEDIDRRMRMIYPVRDDEDPSPHTTTSRPNHALAAFSSLSAVVAQFEDSIIGPPEPLKMHSKRSEDEHEGNNGSEEKVTIEIEMGRTSSDFRPQALCA